MTRTYAILTPTIPERFELLVGRCIRSVTRQTHTDWKHYLLASDRNYYMKLRTLPLANTEVRLIQENPTWHEQSAWKWYSCSGTINEPYVAYLCDDDEWMADHLSIHSGYDDASVSAVRFELHGRHEFTATAFPLVHGNVDVNGLVHRTEDLSLWADSLYACPDWDLIRKINPISIPVTTAIHHDGWLKKDA